MIKAENLCKSYDGVPAIRDINIEIARGEIVAFLGPNGAGKTTTMNIFTCYLSPTSGKASVAGFDTMENSMEVRRRVGYLPEDNPLYEDMTVYEYLDFTSSMRGIAGQEKTDRIKEVSGVCGLREVIAKDIGQLSRGYKQRVGFAQAMFHNPDILILDEPTSGLDPNQAREIRSLIKELKSEKTVIISTHILSEAQAVCDRVMIINRGKIVADGTKNELEKMVGGRDTIYAKLEAPPQDVLGQLPSLEGVSGVRERDCENGGTVHGYEIEIAKGSDIRRELHRFIDSRGWPLLELHSELLSLEDIFRKLTEEGADQ
jgi:ABC-2 type transport system ATP-binding protein